MSFPSEEASLGTAREAWISERMTIRQLCSPKTAGIPRKNVFFVGSEGRPNIAYALRWEMDSEGS